jgi:hypothetical protein
MVASERYNMHACVLPIKRDLARLMSINPIRRRCRHTWKQWAGGLSYTERRCIVCDEFFEHLMLCVRRFWIYLAWRGARLLIKFICYHRRKSCMRRTRRASQVFFVYAQCSAERDNKKQEFSRERCMCFAQAWLPQIIQPDCIILPRAWWNFFNLFNEAGNKHRVWFSDFFTWPLPRLACATNNSQLNFTHLVACPIG